MTPATRISQLKFEQRVAFEAACERIEACLEESPEKISAALCHLPPETGIRELAMWHLGRCWLEGRPGQCSRELTQLVEAVPEIAKLGWIADDLREFVHENDIISSHQTPAPALDTPAPEGRNENGSQDGSSPEFVLPQGYHHVKTLPASGMGLVMVVRHTTKTLDRLEVLKTIKASRFHDGESHQRFLLESQKVANLRHPSIVTVFSADEYNGWPYFTMEYLEGGSLLERIGTALISPEKAACYIAQVARALHALHNAGIVHRDLKPANLMFARGPAGDDVIKVVDLGLAGKSQLTPPPISGEQQRLTGSMTIFGTPGYIAPEQLSEQYLPIGSDRQSFYVAGDVFALGVTLYQAVTGFLPYQTRGARVDLFGPVKNEFRSPSKACGQVDAVFDAICERATHKDPACRFSSAEEFGIALEAWLKTRRPITIYPSTVNPESAGDSGSPTQSKKSLLLGLYAMPVIILVIIGSVFVFSPKLKQTGSKGPTVPPVTAGDPSTTPPTPPVPGVVDPDIQSLVAGGWPVENATRLLAFHRPFLDTLKKSDKNGALAAGAIARFSTLGRVGADKFLEKDPHLAPLLLATDRHREVMDEIDGSLGENDSQEIINLFLRYPNRGAVGGLIDAMHSHRDAVRNLQRKGWIGSEIVFLPARNMVEGQAEFQQWVGEVTKRYALGNNKELAAGSIALMLLHRDWIMNTLENDASFRAKFNSKLWPDFKMIVDKRKGDLANFVVEPRIWSLLAEDGGASLLQEHGLAPVALMYGRHKYPNAFHGRIKELLKKNNRLVVEALLDEQFRYDPNFLKLLGMRIEPKILAVAILVAKKEGQGRAAKLSQFATWDEKRLTHELGEQETSLLERIVPQVIYVKVAVKLLSGESPYSDEWERFALVAFQDITSFGISNVTSLSESDKTSINEQIAKGVGVAGEIRKNLRERLIADSEQKINPEDSEFRQFVDSSLGRSREFILAVERVGNLAKRTSESNPSEPLNQSLHFFRVFTPPAKLGVRLPNLKEVEFFQHREGLTLVQFPKSSKFSKEHPELAEFINSRAEAIRKTSEIDTARRQAWRELAAAWWLLYELDLAPLAED